ncbi:MAG: SpaA isopeptide-forming pilin-related protein [Ruminiclostridium sp.]
MKNKFKKLTSLLLASIMMLVALPIQTLAAEWGKGDTVYAAMIGDFVGSDGKTYADKYNYDYIYYKSDGSIGKATRYASTHAKLGISKNGIIQPAICIEAGVAYNTGSSYVGEGNNNTYLMNLPYAIRRDLKIALLCGFNSDTKSSPVANTNLDDFWFATQVVSWEIQQGLRTGYGKSDLAVNSSIPNTPKTAYYDQLKGRPAEKCYEYILGKMKSYSLIPSFTDVSKSKAPTHVLKYDSSTKKYSRTIVDTNNSGMPASAFNISGVTVTKSGNKYTFSTTTKISGTKACTYKANRTSGDQLVIWKSGNGSQTMAAGIDDPVQFYANFKTSDLGTAQIKKVWNHKNDSSSTQASNSDIYFTIKNSSGTTIKGTGSAGSYTYSTSGSVTQFKLNSSNTFSVKSLPAGTYTVTEYGKNSDGTIPYYTRTGGVSKTVTVTAGGTGTVTFTNTRNTGTGEVIKTWVDTNGNAIEASNCISNNQQIYFYLKNADNKYVDITGIMHSGTYTFAGTSDTAIKLYVNPSTGKFAVSDLPTGKYTVYEYGSPEGYSVNKASQTITISKDKTSSVSFVNSEDSGTAQIKKVWLSDTTLSASEIANLEKNVYFTVKDSDGKYIKVTGSAGAYVYAGTQTSANNMKLSGSKFNVSKLPMGTYTVTEINNASGYNPKTQTKTVTIANKGEIKSISFTNKSTPVVVIRKHFSDENNLTAAQLKEQYAKVTVNLQVLGFSGSVSSNPPAGYYIEFTSSNGNYTYKGISSTKTSATDLKLNENGEMTISFGTNTAPYYLAVIETYSGTDYDVDSRDQRIDLGNGDPNAVIDLDDIELDNQLKTGSVQIDKQFLDTDGSVIKIPDDKLAEVAFKIMHNGKYLTFTGADGVYTYKGENNTGTTLKLNKSTYNFVANELPAREEYTVYEVSGTTGYSFSIDPVTFTITPAGSVKKVFTNKAMTGTISIVKHSADGVLSGWQFRVTGTAKTGQSYDQTFTTDAKGTITISNIRIGDYKVTEVKTGKTVGYITENSKDLEVKTDTVTTVNIENKPYANIVINKVDAKTGEKVSGATFGIYTDAECEIPAQAYTSATDDTLTDAVITESATGKYTCNFLPIESKNGTTYYVKELIAPEGYYLDTNVHAVTLKTANATVSVNNEIGKSDFNEYPYGHGAVIKEWKLDNGTADMTADEIAQMKAELEKSLYFTVRDSNGKYITATGADGVYTYNGESTSEFKYVLQNSTFTIAELPTGDYTVTEFSTLSDYTIKSENPVKITVVRNQTATATFVNERDTGTGKVIKVWKQFDTMTAAEQAEIEKKVYFTVTDSNGAYLKVKESNGSYIYCGTQKTETKFALKNGAFVITELPTGEYTVTEFSTLSDYTIKSENPVKITVVRNQTATATFVNERDTGTGKVVKVWKQFDTMTATEQTEIENNVYFTVTDSNGAYLKVKESNGSYIYCGTQKTETKFALKNGAFVIAELPTGDYTVTEFNNAKDYSPKQQTQKIKITKNTAAVLTFTNIRDTGNASIIKKWTNPNGLTTAQKAELEKNVYFTVKNADGAYLKAVSKNGKYVYNGSQTAEARFMLTNGKFELTELPTGKYTIIEINNAEGYLPKTQVKTITVTKDATASAEFVNKVIVGNVTLTKVDEDYPENKLTGAVFTVYKSDKKTVVGTLKETETGVYSLEGLVYGEYYVQETKAPEYFVRDVNFYYFQIVNDGETVEVSNDELGKGTFINSPQKGEIKIVKTSYDNKVEGIHFEVTGKTYTGQTFKKTYTTDKNGIIRINDLRAGEYNIHEVNDEASAGYLLPEDKQLTIDRDGAMLVANMHNSKLPDNPPTGASEDSFTQTAVIIISMVMMSATVVLVFPLSKRKKRNR